MNSATQLSLGPNVKIRMPGQKSLGQVIKILRHYEWGTAVEVLTHQGLERWWLSNDDWTSIVQPLVDYYWAKDLWCFFLDDKTYSYSPERHKIVVTWVDGKEIKVMEQSPLGIDLQSDLGKAYRNLINVLDVVYGGRNGIS